jgi:nickel/cobalt transporter (NicO) family protein
VAAAAQKEDPVNGISGFEARLIEMFDSGVVFWLALLVALGVGAAHAVAPGHGKSITAAYLVGTRGRYRDALRLGIIVALMHTVSVLVLAIGWVGVSSVASVGTERITAWMQVLAGLVVIAVGLHLAYRHLRGADHHHHRHGDADHDHPHPHDHDHDPSHTDHHHGHDHDHSHTDHDQPHSDHHHDHEGGSGSAGAGAVAVRTRPAVHHHHHHDDVALTDPWSRRGLIAIGLSGGLLPSPSAFLVLVSGLLTGRAFDAIVLVAAFGVGMAATLTAVGALTIRGWSALAGRGGGWRPLRALVARTPLIAGLAVACGGAVYLLIAAGSLVG